MLLLKKIYESYNVLLNRNKDHRMHEMFLLGSPWPLVIIITAYLYIVSGTGQRWMEKRKPFELTKVINVYNIFQMVANAYVFWMCCYYPRRQNNVRLFCIPEPYNDFSYVGNQILRGSHFFFLLKIIDLLDTIFFILRKKNNQVTFLHTYHHAGMATAGYIYCKLYSGGGFATILALINSFVHIVMYGYYFITSYKPEMKNSIWWKKYITQLQLIQFVILFVYCSTSLFTSDCNNSKVFLWIGLTQALVMMTLFSDFYYKAYIKKKN